MKNKLVILVMVLCTMICSVLFFLSNTKSQTEVENNLADKYVKQLWSEDNAERITAKENLIQLGPKAAKPLISLLEDINKNPGLRFATGREIEGKEAWERYNNLPLNKRSVEELNSLMSFVISARLKNDAYEILCAIRSSEAVPTLIEEMKNEEIWSGTDGLTPVMRALVAIGEPSVPQLIEELEKAEQSANSTYRPANPSSETEEIKQKIFDLKTYKIQSRVSLVLGEIGDTRALPVLENLLSGNRNVHLGRIVEHSIKQIRDKSKTN